ncbi:hypothetical protein [Paenirhodobacter sp.]|uniref:hypothetical protein n=1 Tax=Paenirhodobacter sp. TaxID=1965326 RepID=UPI003B3FFA21
MKPLRILALPLLALSLAGCGWFRSETAPTLEPEGGYLKPQEDGRVPVAQVTNVTVEQTLSGAIVRATGLPPTQGWWAARLVAENDGHPVDGVMTYRFLLAPPPADAPRRVLTQESREVTAAAFIRGPRLAGVHQVVVIGAENSRSASR